MRFVLLQQHRKPSIAAGSPPPSVPPSTTTTRTRRRETASDESVDEEEKAANGMADVGWLSRLTNFVSFRLIPKRILLLVIAVQTTAALLTLAVGVFCAVHGRRGAEFHGGDANCADLTAVWTPVVSLLAAAFGFAAVRLWQSKALTLTYLLTTLLSLVCAFGLLLLSIVMAVKWSGRAVRPNDWAENNAVTDFLIVALAVLYMLPCFALIGLVAQYRIKPKLQTDRDADAEHIHMGGTHREQHMGGTLIRGVV